MHACLELLLLIMSCWLILGTCVRCMQDDLTGGYYDAGDNVKFGFPMAFTITMLSWGVIEYKTQLQSSNELSHALEAVKWGTDYFIKAHTAPNVLFGEVREEKMSNATSFRPIDQIYSTSILVQLHDECITMSLHLQSDDLQAIILV
jgi:hypothetical protein